MFKNLSFLSYFHKSTFCPRVIYISEGYLEIGLKSVIWCVKGIFFTLLANENVRRKKISFTQAQRVLSNCLTNYHDSSHIHKEKYIRLCDRLHPDIIHILFIVLSLITFFELRNFAIIKKYNFCMIFWLQKSLSKVWIQVPDWFEKRLQS